MPKQFKQNHSSKNNYRITEKLVSEIDKTHSESKTWDQPNLKFINPIIEDNTQDTLANVRSCVSLICKAVTKGNSEHTDIELFGHELHGLAIFQRCIENALEFEGHRSNLYKSDNKNSNQGEAA